LITVEATSADQALSAISADRPDIALIDFNMPGKNGLDLVSEIRVKYPDMPIAIVTANIQEEISRLAAALNASFIAKPVDEGVLVAFLAEAIAQIEMAK
jgi:DNA-binding NarL/FixJ family response regulator